MYPETEQVTVYYANGSAITYQADQSIPGGDLLLGLSLSVAAIFEEE